MEDCTYVTGKLNIVERGQHRWKISAGADCDSIKFLL